MWITFAASCCLLFSIFDLVSSKTIQVRYGYFTEARPIHVACARKWFNFAALNGDDYKVTCYPQTSGTYAAARLDNDHLQIANLGSTPLAQAVSRRLDIKVIYLSHYAGESQGIYVRDFIQNPFDLQNRTIGVPFGSTMHYQVLFLLDLLDLTGTVQLKNLSPSEIIAAWDDGSIDAGACWGEAREYLLKADGGGNPNIPEAKTLLSAEVIANWGRPTFTAIAANRAFMDTNMDFMTHFVAVLSRLNDSFFDNLGQWDQSNIDRWNAQKPGPISFIPSMADALMKEGEVSRFPSQTFQNAQRRSLDLFIHVTADEQLSCSYFGTCPSVQNSLQDALAQTSKFLSEQKVIAATLEDDDFGAYLERSLLENAYRTCTNCYVVGPYRGAFSNRNNLLSELQRMDVAFGAPFYAQYEIGRIRADSTCSGHIAGNEIQPMRGDFGDGANGQIGLSYGENLDCSWEIRASDCSSNTSACNGMVMIELKKISVWSGDFIRIYGSTDFDCSPESTNKFLLAQVSGFYTDGSFPLVGAQGCVLVQFETDSNRERAYGDDNSGDGFLASYNRQSNAPTDQIAGIGCDNFLWGAYCDFSSHCIGTKRIILSQGSEPELFASSGTQIREDYFPESIDYSNVLTYPNDLNCIYEIQAQGGSKYIVLEIYYDIETSYDFIELKSGSGRNAQTFAVLTGRSGQQGSRDAFERYFVPTGNDGMVTLHFTSDSQGRRLGFYAQASQENGVYYPYISNLLDGEENRCNTVGYSGFNCEFPFCIADNTPSTIYQASNVVGRHKLGRVVSQIESEFVRPMPWAPNGGCKWPLLTPTSTVGGIVAVRLLFNRPLDFEPYPLAAVGDKLIIQSDVGDSEFFIEKCDSDEVCSYQWQTGVCGDNGGCIVRQSLEVQVADPTFITAILVTDMNDGDRDYKGVDFDAVLVEQCPNNENDAHCEAVGGTCVDGYCICGKEGIPCACSCDGSPSIFEKIKAGLVVGIVVPLFLIFVGFFFWYRHRKIQRSRAQKDIISQKEAELDAFRNSVVGMRTAIKDYIPKPSSEQPLTVMPKRLSSVKRTPVKTEIVQWCWKETSHMISKHAADAIVGDPSDCWIKYDNDSNMKLETAFQRQHQAGQFSPLNGYIVDFSAMTQTKTATGYQREVQRLVEINTVQQPIDTDVYDSSRAQMGDSLPAELAGEPQIVLVKGDIMQISQQRQDGWAFGTKLHHQDEALARQLLSTAVSSDGVSDDDANIFTDTGWFQLDATEVPSGEDLAVLQTSVGDTGNLDPPDYWGAVSDPTVVELQRIPKNNDEYNSVINEFMSTLHPPTFKKTAIVADVHRIQNLAMWQSYVVKRQTICYRETGLQSNDATANADLIQRKALERFERRWLWHGTNIEVMDKIMQQGFNRSFCGKNATVYGKGVYFARDASYSAYPTYSVPDKGGFQYIMACRVVVGEYCVGKSDALTPDIRDPTTQSLYDSTVGLLSGDVMASPSIYVTYHDAQAYPEYLIKFKLKS